MEQSKGRPKVFPFIPPESVTIQRVEVFISELTERLQKLQMEQSSILQKSAVVLGIASADTFQNESSLLEPPEDERMDFKALLRKFENPSNNPTKEICTLRTRNLHLKDTIRRLKAKFEENFESDETLKANDSCHTLYEHTKETLQRVESLDEDISSVAEILFQRKGSFSGSSMEFEESDDELEEIIYLDNDDM